MGAGLPDCCRLVGPCMLLTLLPACSARVPLACAGGPACPFVVVFWYFRAVFRASFPLLPRVCLPGACRLLAAASSCQSPCVPLDSFAGGAGLVPLPLVVGWRLGSLWHLLRHDASFQPLFFQCLFFLSSQQLPVRRGVVVERRRLTMGHLCLWALQHPAFYRAFAWQAACCLIAPWALAHARCTGAECKVSQSVSLLI